MSSREMLMGRIEELEAERDRLKAELEDPRDGLKKVKAERDALQKDRDLWKSKAKALAVDPTRP